MRADHRRVPAGGQPRLASLALLWAVASGWPIPQALAQDGRIGIGVGEADLYPALRVEYQSIANVFGTADAEVDGSAVVVSPRLELVADRRQLTVRATYDGAYSRGTEGVSDYADHRLLLGGDAQFGKRRRVRGEIGYRRGHQRPGTAFLLGADIRPDEPVTFDQFEARGAFRYGVVDARGNLEGGLRLTDRRYVNLDDVTDGRDVTVLEPYGLFSYRLSGDTRALLELTYAAIDLEGFGSRDELSLFGGAEFAATGRLRGAVRLGVTRASYDSDDVDDTTLFAARTDVSYLLREYVTLGLRLDRALDDTAAVEFGGGVAQGVTDTLVLSWDHEWTSRIAHSAFLQRTAITRSCGNGGSSALGALGYELDYAVRRWLRFGAGLSVENRADEDCGGGDGVIRSDREFERRTLSIHVRGTL